MDVFKVIDRSAVRKRSRWSDLLAEKIITGIAFFSIASIVLIFVFIFRETLPLFSKTGPSYFYPDSDLVQETYTLHPVAAEKVPVAAGDTSHTAMNSEMTRERIITEKNIPEARDQLVSSLWGNDWYPVSEHPRYGLLPLLFGTLKVSLIAILFAAPLAILAAIFSSAFAPVWLREWIKPAVELLAGIPSVVIGFFALMVMASVLQDLFGYPVRLNAFIGGIAMGLAAIPVIYTITEDALNMIPGNYREASIALGATRWQTMFHITLPAAAPGVFAAILLGIGRVFGETMIALMVTGNAAIISANPFESVRTLAATIGAEMAEVVFGDTHYGVLFLIGSILFVFTFFINALAEFYIKGRLLKKLQGRRW
jgi:phosphate transport system permease protein